MRSEDDLEDEFVRVFLERRLDGPELQKLLIGGKQAFKVRFPDLHKDKTSLLFTSVKDRFEMESAQIDSELSSALVDAAEQLGQRGLVANAAPNDKFEQEFLQFGELEEAALGMAHYMCVEERVLHSLLCKGFASIIEEVANFGTDEVFEPPPSVSGALLGTCLHVLWL